MKFKNIAIFVNPDAGKGKALKVLSTAVSFLEQKGIAHSTLIKEWNTSLENFTDVWIIGGDGTLNYFLNLFPDIKTPLVIFKGGTGNDIAWKLYGDISLEEQLQLVINVNGQLVDAASCNDKIFINGVGIGFDGEVLASMKTIRLFGGHFGYLIIVLKKIFTFKEYTFNIASTTFNNNTNNYLLVMVSNSSRTGGGFHVSPLAKINDGLLNVVLCNKLSLLKRLWYLPVIQKGKHLTLPFIHHFTEKCLLIKCEKLTPAQLDGELIYAKEFRIEILKDKFLFKY